jgi:hypothetical protein
MSRRVRARSLTLSAGITMVRSDRARRIGAQLDGKGCARQRDQREGNIQLRSATIRARLGAGRPPRRYPNRIYLPIPSPRSGKRVGAIHGLNEDG